MIKKNWEAIAGEFVGSSFISFWGLGFVVPFAILGGLFHYKVIVKLLPDKE